MEHRAVIFDLGGVILGSPLHAIARYERELRIEAGFINGVVVDTGREGAWARLERGELPMEAFFDAFEADCSAAGRQISARALMVEIGEAAAPRPQMLEAVRRIRAHGLRAGALTCRDRSRPRPGRFPGRHREQPEGRTIPGNDHDQGRRPRRRLAGIGNDPRSRVVDRSAIPAGTSGQDNAS